MTEIIKLFFVIILIIVLLRLKWDLGLVMFLSSILLGLLFHLGFNGIVNNIYLTIIDPNTLQLIGAVALVYMLSSILRRTKSMEGIVRSLQNIVADYRLILFFIASFLGLIPMPAGAMFSAPLLKEIGEKNHMSPEEIMFSNYWFRHVWEFIWPLYPSIVLYSSLIGVELREVMIIQFPLTISAILIGFFWMYTHLERQDKRKINYRNLKPQILTLFKSLWSILLVIVLVLFLKLNFLVALSVAIVSLLIVQRISLRELKEVLFQDFSLKVIIMIVGIMLFKQILESTHLMNQIPQFFSETGINVWIILFFIPFLIGFLTGLGEAFIGIGFPVFIPIMTQGESINITMAMFALLAGYTGIIISPMHLCLTVTIQYLKADIVKFYKNLFIVIIIFISISSLYIFLLT